MTEADEAHAARRRRFGVPDLLTGLVEVPPWPLSVPFDALTARRLARRLESPGPPKLRRVGQGYSDVLVLRWDRDHGDPLAVKHPRDDRALSALSRETEVVGTLAGDTRLPGWPDLLPLLVASHLDASPPLVLQRWLPGVTAAALVRAGPQQLDGITRASIEAVTALHEATGRREQVGGRLDEWTRPRLELLADSLPGCRTGIGSAGLAALRRRLHTGLSERRLLLAWTHGDFAPENVLLDRGDGQVTGLVDWADAQPDGPADIDLCTFALALGWLLDERCWGEQVVAAVRAGSLRTRGFDAELDPDLVLLTWLWHVSGNLAKSRRYGRNRTWVRTDVVPVLAEAASWS